MIFPVRRHACSVDPTPTPPHPPQPLKSLPLQTASPYLLRPSGRLRLNICSSLRWNDSDGAQKDLQRKAGLHLRGLQRITSCNGCDVDGGRAAFVLRWKLSSALLTALLPSRSWLQSLWGWGPWVPGLTKKKQKTKLLPLDWPPCAGIDAMVVRDGITHKNRAKHAYESRRWSEQPQGFSSLCFALLCSSDLIQEKRNAGIAPAIVPKDGSLLLVPKVSSSSLWNEASVFSQVVINVCSCFD